MGGAPGRFVTSLDFELHWGVGDVWSGGDYRANLEGVRDVRVLGATYHNGVLTLAAGKARDRQPRRIEVREVPEQQPIGPAA